MQAGDIVVFPNFSLSIVTGAKGKADRLHPYKAELWRTGIEMDTEGDIIDFTDRQICLCQVRHYKSPEAFSADRTSTCLQTCPRYSTY